MEPRPVDTQQRVIKLLTALVALMAVLVVSLGVGAVIAWREYSRLRDASHAALGDRDAAALLEEMSARQQQALERLTAMVNDAERQTAAFERRAAAIRARDDGGPIDAAAKAVDLMALMVDQSILGLKQFTAVQDALVKGAPPLGAGAAREDATDADGDEADERAEARGRADRAVPRSARRAPPSRGAD